MSVMNNFLDAVWEFTLQLYYGDPDDIEANKDGKR